MKKHLTKRLLSLVIVLAMCLGMMAVPGFAASESNGITVEKVDNSAVSADFHNRQEAPETAEDTHNYGPHDIVRVSIVVEGQSTLEKSSGKGQSLEGYLGNRSLVNYRASLLNNQRTVASRISSQVLGGGELDVVWNLTLVANIISANVEYGQIEAIKGVRGVENVVLECQYEPAVVSKGEADPNMATSPVQTGSAIAHLAGYTGAGSRIAIIDTGTDTDHQSFASDAFLFALAENAANAGMEYDEYIASLDLLDADEIAAVFSELNISIYPGLDPSWLYVNEKLPFGFNYIDVSLNIVHDYDKQGEHGSHVAGIATANRFITDGNGGFVDALESVYVQGVAPDAQLLTMKVFGEEGGAYDSDYMAAIEDAIVLGADAVNLSLGSAAPGFTTSSTYQHIMDSLTKSDTVTVMSAGNDGKWTDYSYYGTLASLPYLFADDVATHTGGSPGTFTNSLGVASVDNAGFTTLCIKVNGTPITYNERLVGNDNTAYGNAPITSIGGEHEYVFLNNIGISDDGATNYFDAIKDVVAGKVALCYRGDSAFSAKANAAAAAGAIAVIIVNNQPGVINMDLSDYEYTAPVVSILQTDGEYFKMGNPITEGGVQYWTGTMEVRSSVDVGLYDSPFYTMSSFSSWGVPGDLSLKPEITAPGGNIYSVFGSIPAIGTNPANPATDQYEAMSGTSMSAPQVTGMMALMMQYIRENGLSVEGMTDRALAQSLLMSTAIPLYDGESGYYYPVLQQGAGLANVGVAVLAESYIQMGADATDSWADGKVKVELGDDPAKTGSYQFSFSINNLTDEALTYTLSADFFTQDMFSYSGLYFLDTWTTPVNAQVTWIVDGQSADANMDFNGDGYVNTADGQTLLDYATGIPTTLYNKGYADLDKDGDVDSHDAYLFLDSMAINVPANGTTNITVQVQLDDTKLDMYPTGAFVEGYIHVNAVADEEGVVGAAHSIPVLGFYGNWTEPSMYDNYGYVYAGDYTNPISFSTNLLTIQLAGDPTEWIFGGNPMVSDPVYLPERDALSSVNGDKLASYYFTSIRNAGNGLFLVTDAETGEIYEHVVIDQMINSAYFSMSKAAWQQYDLGLGLDWNGEGIPNDTKVNVSLVLAPEYYAEADGSYNWDAILPELGAGAFLTTTLTIDNTAPVIDEESVTIDTENSLLTLLASDNQYVSAVALYDEFGQYLFDYTGSYNEANPGDSLEYVLDLTEVNGPSFLLQVYDYAGNATTYKITQQIGEVVDTVEEVTISKTSLTMIKGNSTTLTATVMPVNAANRNFTWSTSDETVVTVDENGLVTAVGNGTATVTATSAADETKSASCTVTVISVDYTLEGALLDEEANPYTFTWNLAEDSTWTKGVALEQAIAAAAGTDTGAAYLLDASINAISLVDMTTGETLGTGAVLDGAMGDMSLSNLTDAYGSDFLNMISGTWVLFAQDPSAPDYMGLNLASYMAGYSGGTSLVGIQTVGISQDAKGYFELIYALDDAGYFWTIRYYFQTGNISLGYIPTDLDASYDLSYSYSYSSLVLSDDGENFFLAQFDGNTSNIYMINTDEFSAYPINNVGDGVWPAALTGAYSNTAATTSNTLENIEANANWVFVAEDVAVAPIVIEPQAEGGLNSVNRTITGSAPSTTRPASYTAGNPEMGLVGTELTAKDSYGNDVFSTNGVITYAYDPNTMVPEYIDINADYYSVNFDPATGMIVIGYVDLTGIPAGEPVATLIFNISGDGRHPIIEHNEVNNDHPTYHENVDHCMGDWYTVTEATTTEAGKEHRDCIFCSYFEVRYCFGGTYSDPVPGDGMPAPTPGGSGGGIGGGSTIPGGGLLPGVTGYGPNNVVFSDLNSAEWYHTAVDYVITNEIMNGTGDGSTFSPYMNMTRAMMMTMLARLAGVDTTTGSTWYEVGMKWAMDNGISDGTNPNGNITREQLITMLYRYAGSPSVGTTDYLVRFTDSDQVSDWAKDAMNWAVAFGIIKGKGNDTLDPQGLATRVEVAQIFLNFSHCK